MKLLYNRLPRELTLSRDKKFFKTWIDKYYTMTEFQRMPISNDNYYFTHDIKISYDNIILCQSHNDNN